MSNSSDGTQIVVMLQPQGESEASELLARLRTIVSLDPATANGEISDILGDEGLKRVVWATCEVEDLEARPTALQIVAEMIEKLLALRPFSGGRLKAMIMVDDAHDDDDEQSDAPAATADAPTQPLN
jgi:hypothetical protein